MVLLENEYSLICKEFIISEISKNVPKNISLTNNNTLLNNDVITRCVCDFRINFSGCEEETLLKTLHWILVPYCIIILMIAIGFLCYRNHILNQSFWLPSTRERGYLRPKPQEVIHSTTIIFTLFHVIHIIIVLLDAYPNYTMAEVVQGLSRELSIGLMLIYPISIIYTTPAKESRNNICNNITNSNNKSPPNRHIVDIIGFILLIAPILTLLPFTWWAGHSVDTNNLEKARSIREVCIIIWVIWVMIFLISLIYNWYKLFIVIWHHIKELKRKEVSGTSDMQWTVSTLRRAAINLCLAISSLVIIMIVFAIMSFTYGVFHLSHTIFNHNINIIYVIVWNFTIPIILNLVQIFFLYKVMKPKTQRSSIPNSSITSRYIPRKKDDFSRDDESLIGGTPTTASTPITISSTPPSTMVMTNNNPINNMDYFNNSSPNGLNAAAMNSMTNNILQNKTSIEMNRNEAYKRLNSTRSLSRSSSQILTPISLGSNSNNNEEGNTIYPSFLNPRNDLYHRNSIKRPLFIFSDEQTSDEIDLNNTALNNISKSKRISAESVGVRRISKSSSIIGISVGSNTNTNGNDNLGIRRISSHVKHQKSFESSMGLIAEENSDGTHRMITTKKNHSSVSISREASDATSTTLVTTSTTYSASTTVSTTTTVISPAAVAAAKASWNKPDDIDHLDLDERKRLSDSMEKREWLSKRPVSPLPRRNTSSKLSNL
ncbi:hypothetical protein C1645_760341 [Glomus cerebriforme]|uniref:Uncharacterized protein n=1 Tax=Glomus cerebriforme TaxID=658196 RepID=A0A397T7R7_9GLOM|nr:hypothetical protein C1645_760341 [Glomus cerebriforme]